MGYIMSQESFDAMLDELSSTYRIWAPVNKVGEGRHTDTDVVRYDFVSSVKEIEWEKKSDYAFKEILTPLSQTLFFFTEDEVKEANRDVKDVLVFFRSCDMHALKRQDDIYLHNGKERDYFYDQMRQHVHFVLMGCSHSYQECFCVDMGSNQTKDGYVFSFDIIDGTIHSDVKDETFNNVFKKYASQEKDVTPQYVTENDVHVTIPNEIPLSIYKSDMWDEYKTRCIGCGRCNFVCPTCTCYTMQDIYYTDNGKVGERRRVCASCMVDGYTNVAGGGQYRRDQGERMRFKVLHKVYNHRQRFGYDMCVGCGRCTDVCPEYISMAAAINKLNKTVEELKNE